LIASFWPAGYFTLDDRLALDAALRDPDGFISGLPVPAVIDEIQRAPDLMRALKRSIDRNRKPGQYLLTGSANIMALPSVTETLAGRMALHTLYPFSWPELEEKPLPGIINDLFEVQTAGELIKRLPKQRVKDSRPRIIEQITTGGYPPVVMMKSHRSQQEWYSSYRQTYLERDLRNMRAIDNIPDFNRLLSFAALRTGKLLNLSELSRETGLPFSTLRRYMNLLEVTYQVFLLRPYFTHAGKRLVKTPKLYFNDTGMAIHFSGLDDWTTIEKLGASGPMLETWVACELCKILPILDHRFRLYFWRTQAGHEVDFLIERGDRLVAIEVKWASRLQEADARGLARCAEELKDKLRFSVVLYSGTETIPLSAKSVAIPLSIFFDVADRSAQQKKIARRRRNDRRGFKNYYPNSSV
jgi:hypothetical protein